MASRAGASERRRRFAHACGSSADRRIGKGGQTRSSVAAATAPWLLLHDVVHPFAAPDLVRAVLAAAQADGAAAPGVANTEFLYDREVVLRHAPGELLVGQKPVAFSREAVEAAYAAFDTAHGAAPPAGDPSFLDILARSGTRTKFVAGSARNIKITDPADLAFAEALLASERASASRAGTND